jgi:DNA helicase HerA-like ATPase
MQQKEGIIGYIYGDVGSTEFNFAVNGQNVKKFDYIFAPHKEGQILAQIMDIKQHSNLNFEDAAQLMTQEEKPLVKAKISAFADVIGYKDKRNLLQSPRTPFDAGTGIYKAEEDLIRNVLGLSLAKDNGAYIGLLKGHDLQVYLNIDTMVQKHICILAKTGGGKSYACGVLVEELLKNKIPLVIIDTHGEYRSLKEPNANRKEQKNMEKFGVKKNSYSSQIIEYSPLGKRGNMNHITLNGVNLEANEILDLLPASLSGPQKGVLYQAIKEIKEYKSYFTIRDIIDTIHRSKSNAKWNVIASLESLDSIGVFSENATNTVDLVKKGKCSLINMKGVPPDVQTVVVARLTKQLFDQRKAGKIPPFLFIVEEAHNYCPERGYGSAVSSSILRTIASEGRKFGMGLCVVSQRPAKVDKNIISQCNTNIILKVTNPNDLKAIIQSVEGLTNQTYREIQRLPIGVALISGGTLQMPVMTEIRTRETNHGGRSVKISKTESESFEYKPVKTNPPVIQNELNESSYQPQTSPQPTQPITPVKPKTTDKAKNVTRVAHRLGWVNTDNPDEAIKILTEEAEKMNENVYKYLESLAKLGKNLCNEQNPKCMSCPMKDGCNYRASLSSRQKKGLFTRNK